MEDDGLWMMSDEQLIALASQELARIGLVRDADIVGGKVVRMPKAYPVYDGTYEKSLHVIREFLTTLKNLQVVGRNGMHRYNNQDHSMLTAMLAVRNILGARHDLFSINAEPEYHEEIDLQADPNTAALLAETQPLLPQRISAASAAASTIQNLT